MAPVFGFTHHSLFKTGTNTTFSILLHLLGKFHVLKADTDLLTLFRDGKSLSFFW